MQKSCGRSTRMEKPAASRTWSGRTKRRANTSSLIVPRRVPKAAGAFATIRKHLDSRKEFPPEDSAVAMAAAMGIELLTEEQYFELQALGEFDLLTTSSWVKTPAEFQETRRRALCRPPLRTRLRVSEQRAGLLPGEGIPGRAAGLSRVGWSGATSHFSAERSVTEPKDLPALIANPSWKVLRLRSQTRCAQDDRKEMRQLVKARSGEEAGDFNQQATLGDGQDEGTICAAFQGWGRRRGGPSWRGREGGGFRPQSWNVLR